MRYLHTMVRAKNLKDTLDFYCDKLGLIEIRRHENEVGRFTLIFLATPEDAKAISTAADGVVVGSSIVKVIEKNINDSNKIIESVGKFVKDLKEGTNL